jgi:hypothetical protein
VAAVVAGAVVAVMVAVAVAVVMVAVTVEIGNKIKMQATQSVCCTIG